MSKNLNARLAAVAAVAAIGAVETSQAATVYSGVVNLAVPNTFDGLYSNLVTNTHNSNSALVTGWDVDPWVSGGTWRMFPNSNGANADGGVVGVGANASNLAVGTPINAASGYLTAAATNAPIGNGVIVGLRIFRESTSTIHFGWARYNLANGSAGTLVDYAYEDVAGAESLAGVVPTPGAASLLAVGAAGLLRRRRA